MNVSTAKTHSSLPRRGGRLEGAALPQFVLDLLAAPPPAGEGVHNYLFRVARVLHPYRNKADIHALLATAVTGCGRNVPDSEVANAIENSKAMAWQPRVDLVSQRKQPLWPPVDRARRAAVIAEAGGGLVDLWEISPIRIEDNAAHAEVIVDVLFPGDPLLCVGRDKSRFKTRHREKLRGELCELAVIVPSPMSAQTGKTKGGKQSEHTLDNTGPRRFLVIEFDDGATDDHAALLLHLAEIAPLVLVVHSGGKSLHGWFYCFGQSEDTTKRFMRYAVSLGADAATWTRSQFVRMPDGTRETGQRQTVYFFNPAIVEDAR